MTTYRIKLEDGSTATRIIGLPCYNCAAPLDDRLFIGSEPKVGLCTACAKPEDYGLVAKDHRESKPLRYVAAESEPGESSGRPRHWSGMGNAENANGCWDNMIRAMEGE